MNYFSSQQIEVLSEITNSSMKRFISPSRKHEENTSDRVSKVGVQVEKNGIRKGEEIKEKISKAVDERIEVSILADSDRCCIDWVAVTHSDTEYLIKASFSCPLLGASRSERAKNLLGILQYLPNNEILEDKLKQAFKSIELYEAETAEKLSSIRSNVVYLAVDSYYLRQQKEIQTYLSAFIKTNIKIWSYNEKIDENSVVIVVSANKGFIEYFKDNTKCICIEENELINGNLLASKIFNDYSQIDTEKVRRMILKLSLAEKIKNAKTIGIVFTSGDHLSLVHLIAAYLDKHEKKFYQFFINGLKPEKLGNFLGIDLFVVVQCPFSSFRFEKNIIAVRPYDLILAFSSTWSGTYSTCLETAQALIQSQLQEKTDYNLSLSSDFILPEIRSSINALDLKNLQDLQDTNSNTTLAQYFRTGEFLKSVTPNTIAENTSPGTPINNELIAGYYGLPTQYTSINSNNSNTNKNNQ